MLCFLLENICFFHDNISELYSQVVSNFMLSNTEGRGNRMREKKNLIERKNDYSVRRSRLVYIYIRALIALFFKEEKSQHFL